MQRRRFGSTFTFPDCHSKEAERLRVEAERLPYGPEREALQRKARQLDTAAKIDKWVGSPGLQPPSN